MTSGVERSDMNELGYFGNIWVRSHKYNKGENNGGGHTHHFDHITLLISGKVQVEVEGHTPKIFTAPKFIVIKKEHKHRFTALEDNTVYYCVFALRDIDGSVTDIYSGDDTPYGAADLPDPGVSTEQQILDLDKKTTF
jgi:hypothetical protein